MTSDTTTSGLQCLLWLLEGPLTHSFDISTASPSWTRDMINGTCSPGFASTAVCSHTLIQELCPKPAHVSLWLALVSWIPEEKNLLVPHGLSHLVWTKFSLSDKILRVNKLIVKNWGLMHIRSFNTYWVFSIHQHWCSSDWERVLILLGTYIPMGNDGQQTQLHTWHSFWYWWVLWRE